MPSKSTTRPGHDNCRVCIEGSEADQWDAELEYEDVRRRRCQHTYIEADGTSGATLLICRACGAVRP